MVKQGLGYSGRTIFSGAAEMVARAVVSLGFVGTFGYRIRVIFPRSLEIISKH